MDELKDLVTKKKYHIIGITESWARNEIDDSELHTDGYVMYRHDRPPSHFLQGSWCPVIYEGYVTL